MTLSYSAWRQMNRLHFLRMLLFVVAIFNLRSTQVEAWLYRYAPSPSTIPNVCRSSSISSTTTSKACTGRAMTRLEMAVSSCWADEQGRELVERFGAVWEDEVEKIFAYESLQLSESRDNILDAALDYIGKTSKESRLLAQRRWRVRFPSRRATVGCYGRILAEMNAGRIVIDGRALDVQTTTVDSLASEEKSRQHLNHLFELLSTYPKGIWGLEREMMDDAGIKHFGLDVG